MSAIHKILSEVRSDAKKGMILDPESAGIKDSQALEKLKCELNFKYVVQCIENAFSNKNSPLLTIFVDPKRNGVKYNPGYLSSEIEEGFDPVCAKKIYNLLHGDCSKYPDLNKKELTQYFKKKDDIDIDFSYNVIGEPFIHTPIHPRTWQLPRIFTQ